MLVLVTLQMFVSPFAQLQLFSDSCTYDFKHICDMSMRVHSVQVLFDHEAMRWSVNPQSWLVDVIDNAFTTCLSPGLSNVNLESS